MQIMQKNKNKVNHLIYNIKKEIKKFNLNFN